MLEIFSKNHNQTDSEQQTQSLPVNIATFYQIYQNLYLFFHSIWTEKKPHV